MASIREFLYVFNPVNGELIAVVKLKIWGEKYHLRFVKDLISRHKENKEGLVLYKSDKFYSRLIEELDPETRLGLEGHESDDLSDKILVLKEGVDLSSYYESTPKIKTRRVTISEDSGAFENEDALLIFPSKKR